MKSTQQQKKFCIAGPINPSCNYFISHRLDWKNLQSFIDDRFYFVLHAPRQSGKTTAVLEFCEHLNKMGAYNALYINVESVQAVRENVEKGLLAILRILERRIKKQLPNEKDVLEFFKKKTSNSIDYDALNEALEYLAEHSSKPLVLFIDEIDSLVGDTLLSVLRQIRAGFHNRPKLFPHALCLIGLRDVRDYRIWSKGDHKYVPTSSPFNIKAESLVLPNFDLKDIQTLYEQHTQETGQIFNPDAIAYVYELTAGQPWLVNALAYQACYRDVDDLSKPITKEVIERAKEAIIKRRDTHLDSLIDKLQEPRVRPIIESIITGETDPGNIQADDLQYVRDLGIVRPDRLDIANPIYREIIPRELTSVTMDLITQTAAPFINADGSLNMTALIEAFVVFYRDNSEIWLDKFEYKEAGPHLLLMAFLQRVINGGGTLIREYALGRRRVDILLKWRRQNVVIELKISYNPSSLTDGIKQTGEYMDGSGAKEGHLILFDRDPAKSWEEKIFHHIESFGSKKIHVWGC